MSGFLYLDSSAIVKLVVNEAESSELRRHLHPQEALASCGLARVEVLLAVADSGREAVAYARSVLNSMHLVQLSDALLDAAGTLGFGLGSLDAIHMAAARGLGEDLESVITYDRRMAAAATAMGLAVAAPA